MAWENLQEELAQEFGHLAQRFDEIDEQYVKRLHLYMERAREYNRTHYYKVKRERPELYQRWLAYKRVNKPAAEKASWKLSREQRAYVCESGLPCGVLALELGVRPRAIRIIRDRAGIPNPRKRKQVTRTNVERCGILGWVGVCILVLLERGLSQRETARTLGISKTPVTKLATGRYKVLALTPTWPAQERPSGAHRQAQTSQDQARA